jgi:hypothetical protein
MVCHDLFITDGRAASLGVCHVGVSDSGLSLDEIRGRSAVLG